MGRNPKKAKAKKRADAAAAQALEEEAAAAAPAAGDDEAMEEDGGGAPAVWRPGAEQEGGAADDDDMELEYDPSAYDCLHAFRLEWPCLSVDVVADGLGDRRATFPHSATLVAGTQAANPKSNAVALVRLTNVRKTRRGGGGGAGGEGSDSDDGESSDDEEEEAAGAGGAGAPTMQVCTFPHHGGVNRIRSMPQHPAVVATWGETGHVQVWDFSRELAALAAAPASAGTSTRSAKLAPRQIYAGHGCEGYAVDWSPVHEGRLATGDCAGRLRVWEPTPAGKWAVEGAPYAGHTASCEDIQWSPTEAGVLASGGVDRTIFVWDVRQRAQPALSCKAHDADLNVLSWNRVATYMLATGCDDGSFRIWDLRNLKPDAFVAHFTYHRGPVTSIEWSRFESSMLATASADNSVCVWDLAVERDAEEEAAAMAAGDNARPPEDLPPQLMFVHMGMSDPKELRWHHQVPGLMFTTAADGLNVFKPSNVGLAADGVPL